MTALTDQPPINSCSSIAGPPPSLPGGRLAPLSAELERWPELGLKTLVYHLGQSDATAADGHWHAAVHEARSFLEALVLGMALAVAATVFGAAVTNYAVLTAAIVIGGGLAYPGAHATAIFE